MSEAALQDDPQPAASQDPAPAAPGPEATSPRPAPSVDERILFHEELSWKQLDDLDRERTVFLVTCSPLDQHGPHLPVGVDCFVAQAFAAAAARRLCATHPDWTVVLSPLMPAGSQTFDYLGSVEVRRRVVRDLLTDFGSSLAAYDFRDIAVVSSHGAPGHVMAVDEACAAVNDRFGARMFAPTSRILQRLFSNGFRETLRNSMDRAGAELDFSTDQHAGHLETSIMLYLRPELVDPGYSRLKPVQVDPGKIDESAAAREADRLGYFGAPAQADREVGRAVVALVGREVARAIEAAQTDPSSLDAYRPPLFNAGVVYRTDFMRWVLGALLVLLALGTWALFLR